MALHWQVSISHTKIKASLLLVANDNTWEFLKQLALVNERNYVVKGVRQEEKKEENGRFAGEFSLVRGFGVGFNLHDLN